MNLWVFFRGRFPNAKFNKLSAYKYGDSPNVAYHRSDGGTKDVFDEEGNFLPSLYFSDEMKKDLGISGFPLELTVNPKPKLLTPAVPFHDNPHSLYDKLINHEIYVPPNDKFNMIFRDIFSKFKIQLTTGNESRKWLKGPNMSLFGVQLRVAE